MVHKIIQTENYLLVVDDSKIKDYYYDFFVNKLKHSGGAKYAKSDIAKQVIAHLPLNNSPILEGVDLLPPIDDKSENGKYKYTDEDLRRAIILAREQHLVKYTDNDYDFDHKEDEIIQSIQQPKYPVAFECEMGKIYGCEDPKICLRGCHLYDNSCKHPKIDKTKPKTITNSERKIQWVGRYVY
jgi:hypothetical protein